MSNKIFKNNPNRGLLENYKYLHRRDDEISVAEHWPQLEDILDGAANSSFGKMPMSKVVMLDMLRDLDVISTESVMKYTNFSKSHSEKMAMHMRVLVNAFDNLVAQKNIMEYRASSKLDLIPDAVTCSGGFSEADLDYDRKVYEEFLKNRVRPWNAYKDSQPDCDDYYASCKNTTLLTVEKK